MASDIKRILKENRYYSGMTHTDPHTRQHGFTLIELAIAFVIVGIVAGAIATYSSFVENARIVGLAKDFSEIENGINNFIDYYNCMPGDCANASTIGIGSNGNGNGAVDSNNEGFYLWQHLGNARMIKGNYNGSSQVYQMSIPGVGANIGAYSGSDRTSILIGKYSGANVPAYAFTPAFAAAVDNKYDDGYARGVSGATNANRMAAAGTGTALSTLSPSQCLPDNNDCCAITGSTWKYSRLTTIEKCNLGWKLVTPKAGNF